MHRTKIGFVHFFVFCLREVGDALPYKVRFTKQLRGHNFYKIITCLRAGKPRLCRTSSISGKSPNSEIALFFFIFHLSYILTLKYEMGIFAYKA